MKTDIISSKQMKLLQAASFLGRYNWQQLNSQGLEEKGEAVVQANLLYVDDASSYWKKVLKAIDERIAGKAIDPAKDVTVGDKRISYYTLDELLKLRDFVLQKIAEEDEDEGIETASPNDEKRILFKWSLR